MRARWLSLAAFLIAIPIARATPNDLQEARDRFRDGVDHARRSEWDEARAAFEAAYALFAEPNTLFNLAGAQRRTGRLLSSHANYRRFAALESLPRDQRQLAARLADEVEAAIPRLRIAIEGLTARDRLLLDRNRLYADELSHDVWLDPGSHTVRVDRQSGNAEVRTFVMSEKEIRVLSLRLP